MSIDLHLSVAALAKVVAFGIGLALIWLLRDVLGVLCLSVLWALTLEPVVAWLEKRGVRNGLAVPGLGALALGLLVGFVALVVPRFAAQASQLLEHVHDFQQTAESRTTGLTHRAVTEIFAWPESEQAKEVFRHSWSWGRAVIDGVSGLGLAIIVTLYLLLDGKRLYAWLLSYVPRQHRARVAVTAPEVTTVVRAYVRGQAITCSICFLYAWGALSLFHVPAAIPLAILASLLDVLPVLGFICSVVPAALFALTVSPGAALGVLGAYVGYHLLETYGIAPRIYGKQLRLSTLTVLLSILLGAEVGGVLGALLILPCVAAYPIIERRWLGGYLARETLEDHAALDRTAEVQVTRAAEEVIAGVPQTTRTDPGSRAH